MTVEEAGKEIKALNKKKYPGRAYITVDQFRAKYMQELSVGWIKRLCGKEGLGGRKQGRSWVFYPEDIVSALEWQKNRPAYKAQAKRGKK